MTTQAAKRPRGRPRLDDIRKPRGGFNDLEWSRVKRAAKREHVTAAELLRRAVNEHIRGTR